MSCKIGVVGLGTMGLGIAQVFAASGFSTFATDAHPPARDSALARMTAALDARVAAGKLTPQDRAATLANLHIAPDLTGLAACDLVIEAIVETLAAKQSLIAALEGIVADSAILATNTSSIPVAQIAAQARLPERILALHFFNPPTAMKLVELAPHAGTAPQSVVQAQAILAQTGKTVIPAPDRPGFIVNRCARPFYGEALALLEEGHAPAQIDSAMQAMGYRLGPFALIDLIGADINLAATQGLYNAMGQHPRYHVFAALAAQVASGDLGQKSGRGFVYPARTEAQADADIALRIEATLINEAAWLLAEAGAPSAQDIDTAMKLGLNFPRGPFEALAQHGHARVQATLAALHSRASPAMKPRYLPAPLLETP